MDIANLFLERQKLAAQLAALDSQITEILMHQARVESRRACMEEALKKSQPTPAEEFGL
jgi:hypothetical protein